MWYSRGYLCSVNPELLNLHLCAGAEGVGFREKSIQPSRAKLLTRQRLVAALQVARLLTCSQS